MTKKNQIMDCPDAEAIASFRHNIQDEWLARQLGQDKPRTMSALTSLMTRFCTGKVNWLARRSHNPEDPRTSEVQDGNRKPKHNKNKHRHNNSDANDTAINAGFRNSRPGQRKKPPKGNRDRPTRWTRSWRDLARSTALKRSPPTTPTVTVGSSNRPASSLPWTKARARTVRTRMNPVV